MPLVKYTTRLRTPGLRIIITHTLQVPDLSSPSQQSESDCAKSRIYSIQRPKDIDILPCSQQLSFLVSGSVDGKMATADEIRASGFGRHLLRCMRRNATFLGIQNISDIQIENGIPNISCTSSHPLPSTPNPSSLKLVSLELAYLWTSTSTPLDGDEIQEKVAASNSEIAENPITSPCILPFGSILDQVVHRLFSHHILPHYPLIFGPYAHSIRAEQVLFPMVAKSLCSIIKRSKSKVLKRNALTSIKELRYQNVCLGRTNRRTLSEINPLTDSQSDDNEYEEEYQAVNALDEFTDILGLGLTSMFKRRIKPWNKGLHIHTHDDVDKDLAVSPAPDNVDEPLKISTCGASDTAEFSPVGDEDLWIEDLCDWSYMDQYSQDSAGANIEEDAFSLDIQDADPENLLEPCSAASPDLSDSDLMEGIQLALNSPVLYEHEGCQVLDSDDEFLDIFVDETHDLPQVHSSLQSHEPSLLKKRADPLKLLSDPAHTIYTLSGEHAFAPCNGKNARESLDSCIRDRYLDDFVSVVDVGLCLEDVDSDMEVLEFDLPAVGERSSGDVFSAISRPPNSDLLSQVPYQQRDDLTVCSDLHRDGQSETSRRMGLDIVDFTQNNVDASSSSRSSSFLLTRYT